MISAAYTQWYDGMAAVGRFKDELYLEQFPVTAVSLVQEDGVTLVSGTGYDATGNVQVLREDYRGVLRRQAGGSTASLVGGSPFQRWSRSYSNIKVVYTAGWLIDDVPQDLAQACIELALLMYKQAGRSGTGSLNMGGGTVEIVAELPDRTQRAIESYARMRPRMRAA